jgi:protein-disulfide isomerase
MQCERGRSHGFRGIQNDLWQAEDVIGGVVSFSSKFAAGLCALLIVAPSFSFAQSAGKKPEAAAQGITREQADQILQELRQIHQLLASGAAAQRPAQPAAVQPTTGKLSIEGLPVLGKPDAPLLIVEFSDYQCPFCRAFHNDTFNELKKNWIDTGKARFVSWDVPLEFHSHAAQAAQAARCAAEQNQFWELRAQLISNAAKLADDDILGYAQQLPLLNGQQFAACLKSDKYAEAIKKSVAVANSQGITGTPTFLLSKSKGSQIEGSIIIGAQPYASFERELNQLFGK